LLYSSEGKTLATGVPRTRWKKADRPGVAPAESLTVTLSYEGKRSLSEVLDTPAGTVKTLWKPARTNPANRLYFGDNLGILSGLRSDPEVCGHVRLVYIDPPFATRSVFQSRSQKDAYQDLLAGSHYVEFLRQRLILVRELLADDGSIYLHIDDNMAPYIKVIMDEVFGRSNFRNWITRKKCNPKNYTRRAYGNVTDYLLFYSKTDSYVWHRPVEGWTAERAAKEYDYTDESTGRRYKKVPVHAPGTRNGETGKPWRGKLPPPGKHWQFAPNKLDEFDARGLIYWSPNGNPRRKIFLDESAGVAVQDLWLEFRDAHNQNIHISGYPTEKNPELLARIVEASSNPGDLVLDCFSGSGTTLAVAANLKRRWIGVDKSREAIECTLRRFAKGLAPMGDFVGKRGAQAKADRKHELPLFGSTPAEKIAGETHAELYEPKQIKDFALCSTAEDVEHIRPYVEKWKDWIDC
jgi:adenine-specific DNA-methyltransferase